MGVGRGREAESERRWNLGAIDGRGLVWVFRRVVLHGVDEVGEAAL